MEPTYEGFLQFITTPDAVMYTGIMYVFVMFFFSLGEVTLAVAQELICRIHSKARLLKLKTTIGMIPLKPCPCCGNEARVHFSDNKFFKKREFGHIYCSVCTMRTDTDKLIYAATIWNRRPETDDVNK